MRMRYHVGMVARWGFSVVTLLARMERAMGEHAMKLIGRDLAFWETTGNQAAIEEWRQRQMKRMYSFDEFIGCVKQRF